MDPNDEIDSKRLPSSIRGNCKSQAEVIRMSTSTTSGCNPEGDNYRSQVEITQMSSQSASGYNPEGGNCRSP